VCVSAACHGYEHLYSVTGLTGRQLHSIISSFLLRTCLYRTYTYVAARPRVGQLGSLLGVFDVQEGR